MKTAIVASLVLVLWLGVARAAQQEKPTGPVIEDGSQVQLDYTVKDDAGNVLGTSKDRRPLAFTQGQHQVIVGLEKAVKGLRAGQGKKITVKPEEGYGMLDPKAETEVAKEAVPQDALKVGNRVMWRLPSGQMSSVRVKQIKEKTVVLDLNHRLAGKTLHFEVKVLSVEPPKK